MVALMSTIGRGLGQKGLVCIRQCLGIGQYMCIRALGILVMLSNPLTFVRLCCLGQAPLCLVKNVAYMAGEAWEDVKAESISKVWRKTLLNRVDQLSGAAASNE